MSRARVERVLMTTDTVGGIWHYALELARGLSEHGIEVALATLGAQPSADQHRSALSIKGLTLHPSNYPLEWMSNPWDDLQRAGDWLLKLATDTRPDIVHLNHYCHGALPWPAPVMVAAHSCVYSWFEAVHGAPPNGDWQRYHEAVDHGLASADMVVAPSAAMLSAIEKFYGSLPNTRVIANGRRSAEFRPRNKRARILAAGRLWDEGKNVLALARIAPHLPWPVRLVGDARRPDGRKSHFANVEWIGTASSRRLAREYAAAAIYALPARYEPFGLSILEAALAGCPLVLGDIPSLREVWGRAALYVKPDDERGLANALNGLIANGIERQAWGVRARHRARRYSAARMTKGYLQAYGDLLDSRAAAHLSDFRREPVKGLG
ncbi:MAG TPA: glycosyltransferase family 4 protein [Gammaproteobacteria bacterium]|nr:glycosyltransferase family 4 protein [Gammaproteobacteria bacterium]